MPRATIVTLLLLGVATLGGVGTSHARTYDIAVIEDIPGTRVAVELLQEAYRMNGHKLRPQLVPSQRALFMAENGLVDGDLFRIEGIEAEHPNLVPVPYPLLHGHVSALLARAGNECADKLPDGPLIAAVRRGVIIEKRAAQSLGLIPVYTGSYAQVEMLLDSGRVDLALISEIEGISPLTRRAFKRHQKLCAPVARFTLFHYLHRRHAELANTLAETLEQLETSGEKQRILERAYKQLLDMQE